MEEGWSEQDILASLNEKQRQAVTAPCSGILQIIAGPGTGKTKVIVCRVAHLLLHENVPPESILVTTFTKKAANEMMSRLRDLLAGTEINVGKLLVGTFHSICYKIIQKYGSLIDIAGFTIADEKDSSRVLAEVLSKKITPQEWFLVDSLDEKETALFKNTTGEKNNGYDAKKVKRSISSLKSAGLTYSDYSASATANKFLAIVYTHYQLLLQSYSLLDFDDCLLYCQRIVSKYPVLKNICHTLVDEFQDTNEIQLRLMYAFAKGNPKESRLQNNVTIVGDPDQSIYAFRDAQSLNFEKMRDHYISKSLQCKTIILDENYRSTSGILQLSESVMRQQSGRAGRNLRSHISKSFKPLKATLTSADEEARWIALQIDYLTKLPNSVVSHSDISVLVRTAFQTRAIENEFVRRKIPYFMVRGRAFWDRKEVAIMTDYLRCVANENDRLAYIRTLNFPKRGFGPKAISDVESMIDEYKKLFPNHSVFQILKICSNSSKSLLPPSLRTKLNDYLELISKSKECLQKEFDTAEGDYQKAVETSFSHLYRESGLQREFEAETDMDLNIKEVKTQMMAFEFREEVDPFTESEEEQVPPEKTGLLFLQQFLESISLYDVDPGKVDEAKSTSKVSISTIHGAKGLEWPVVFIPGVSENLLPAAFAIGDGNPESVNEERRCFFVALTRAKHLLYISAYTEKANEGKWGRKPIEKVSRFLENLEGMCTSALELDTAENLSKFYGFSGLEFSPNQFDVKAHFDNFSKQMSVYVRREEEEELFSSFTTAGQVKHRRVELQRTQVRLGQRASAPEMIKSKAPPSLGTVKLSSDAPQKAPSYVPERRKAAAFTPMRPVQGTSMAAGANKAPAYVPTRVGTKRRLGTR